MFGRKVQVTVQRENTEIDGVPYDYIKTFGISISSFGNTWELEGFDPSETVYLIKAISEARKLKKKYLRITLDTGFFIDVPRWAYTELIWDIWDYIGYKHGDSEK